MDAQPPGGRGEPTVTKLFQQPPADRGRGKTATGSLPRTNQGPAPQSTGRGGPPGSAIYPQPPQGYPPTQYARVPVAYPQYPGTTGYSAQQGGYPTESDYPGRQRSSGEPQRDDFTFRPLTQGVGEQTPAQAEEGRSCCVSTVKVLAIAFIAAALFAGLIGTLVYTGVMEVGLLNCGTMTTDAGLYTLLAGFGSAVVASVVYTILTCNKCETNELDESGDPRRTGDLENFEPLPEGSARLDGEIVRTQTGLSDSDSGSEEGSDHARVLEISTDSA